MQTQIQINDDQEEIELVFPFPRKVFNDVILDHLYEYENRLEVHYGGASSGKSHGIYQKIILKGLKDWSKPRRIMIMRKVGATIRDSSFQHVKDILSDFDIYNDCKINKSDFNITLPNGATIMFKGLDDPEKIKSIKGISDIVMEEATEFTLEDFTQLNLRLRDKQHKDKQIYVLFNPVSKKNWVFPYFFNKDGTVNKDTGAIIYKTTYKDNRFLDEITKAEIENLRKTNPTYYKIYALGDFATLDKLVFPTYETRIIPETEVQGLPLYVGMDFGYVNDPSAIAVVRYKKPYDEEIEGKIVKHVGRIYITKEYVKKGMLNDEIAKTVIDLGLQKEVIFADSSEEKSVEEIKRKGVPRIKPVQKGYGSIKLGIQWILQSEIIVDERCFETRIEMDNYSFTKDKDGEYTNDPVDSFNHLIDAIRYALSELIRGGGGIEFYR